MRKDFINVVPGKQKTGWSIYKGAAKTPLKNVKTKREAETFGRQCSRKWGMSLALYNLDGKLSQRNSFVKPITPVKPIQKRKTKVAKPTRRRTRR